MIPSYENFMLPFLQIFGDDKEHSRKRDERTTGSRVKGTFKGPARQSLSVYVSVGYEDGETFEELTKVQLEKQSAAELAEIIIDTFAGQQQQ